MSVLDKPLIADVLYGRFLIKITLHFIINNKVLSTLSYLLYIYAI